MQFARLPVCKDPSANTKHDKTHILVSHPSSGSQGLIGAQLSERSELHIEFWKRDLSDLVSSLWAFIQYLSMTDYKSRL